MNRLYRHPTDRIIGGVAAGLGVWMNVDPTIVRIAWVLLAIFTGGIFLILYFVMLFVVPVAPEGWDPRAAQGPGSGPAPGGWGSPAGPASTGWGSSAGPASTASGDAGSAPPPGATAPGSPPQTPPWPRSASPSIGNGNAGIVAGVVLVLLGAWFLVDQFLHIDWSLLWPVLVILAGVALIVIATRRGTRTG